MLKALSPVVALGMLTVTPVTLPSVAAAEPNPGMEICKNVIRSPAAGAEPSNASRVHKPVHRSERRGFCS
jgi:hypothetical protein